MKYQIVADESVDFRIVIQLRQSGLTVYAIVEQKPSIKDEANLPFLVNGLSILGNYFVEGFGRVNERREKI
jgi:hypothetical protein